MERWVEEIEGWESRPVAAGFDGLRSLAADEFSGAVSAGDAWLLLVNGRGVGVFEYASETAAAAPTVSRGSLDAFDGADLTAYAAPHHSIPLLIAMQAGETTPRARYYTEDTPIPEVHETLTEGGFTGYLELSENVLSGDYYVVYQAGRSAEVAFIGNSRRIETDEDAFERACDEVGIYEVVAASIEPVDLPDPESGSAAGTTAAAGIEDTGGAGHGEGDAGDATDGPDTAGAAGSPDRSTGSADPAAGADGDVDAAGDASAATGTGASPGTDGTAGTDGTEDDTGDTSGTLDSLGSLDELDEFGGTSGSADDAGGAGADDGAGGPEAAGSADAPDVGADTDAGGGDAAATGDDQEADGDRAVGADAGPHADLVPAITEVEADTEPAVESDAGEDAVESDIEEDAGDEVEGEDTDEEGGADRGAGTAAAAAGAAGSAAGAGQAAALRDRLAERETELDAVRRERDELAARVSELEATVEELRAGDAASSAAAGGEALSVADALAGTNLFVRYRSKEAATLSDAVGGGATREELADNLRIEHHTGFEAAGTTVDGEPFESWLTGTHQFRFLRWLVTALPFEIRGTGSQEALRDLYGALPEIDRVELDGTIPTGEEASGTFDLVALDQMGDPLLVAEIDPDREPVTETGVADLVRSATSVAEAHPDLAAAFHVTEAFFRPRAMETAREATSGSLLSRDSRRSFVKISRNRGYHLCLVEARDDSYYLSVPDL